MATFAISYGSLFYSKGEAMLVALQITMLQRTLSGMGFVLFFYCFYYFYFLFFIFCSSWPITV